MLEAISPLRIPPFRQTELDYSPADVPADVTDAARESVTGLLNATPVPIDELVRQSGLAPAAVQTVLLELELAGRLDRHAGGRVSLQ